MTYSPGMDVRIGVLHCPKELTLEVDGDASELETSVNETLRAAVIKLSKKLEATPAQVENDPNEKPPHY